MNTKRRKRKLDKLVAKRDKLINKIYAFKDGFKYMIEGNIPANNIESAVEILDMMTECYSEAGRVLTLYTDNPEAKEYFEGDDEIIVLGPLN